MTDKLTVKHRFDASAQRARAWMGLTTKGDGRGPEYPTAVRRSLRLSWARSLDCDMPKMNMHDAFDKATRSYADGLRLWTLLRLLKYTTLPYDYFVETLDFAKEPDDAEARE